MACEIKSGGRPKILAATIIQAPSPVPSGKGIPAPVIATSLQPRSEG